MRRLPQPPSARAHSHGPVRKPRCHTARPASATRAAPTPVQVCALPTSHPTSTRRRPPAHRPKPRTHSVETTTRASGSCQCPNESPWPREHGGGFRIARNSRNRAVSHPRSRCGRATVASADDDLCALAINAGSEREPNVSRRARSSSRAGARPTDTRTRTRANADAAPCFPRGAGLSSTGLPLPVPREKQVSPAAGAPFSWRSGSGELRRSFRCWSSPISAASRGPAAVTGFAC
jgi:hypothetical protein